MKKILIHSHPQYAYLARCVLLSKKYHFQDRNESFEYLLLHGNNYIGHLEDHFKQYLEQTSLLEQLFGRYRQESFNNELSINIPENYRDSQKNFCEAYFENDASKYQVIIKDALRDSLCRGLTRREATPLTYFTGTDEFQEYAEKQEWINFLVLFYRYRNILERESPDIVYISHGNYSPYISLLCAAKSLEIEFCIVHGGHKFIYQPNESNNYLSFSPLNAVRDALHYQFPEPFNCKLVQANLDVRDENSYVKTAHRRGRINNPAIPKIDCINIALPIFTEVNNHYSSEGAIFKNRYDWLRETVKIIEKTSLPVIIKRHPHEAEQEPHLVNCLINQLLNYCPRLQKSVQVVKSPDELEKAYKAIGTTGYGTEHFIYQSMSSCELPQLGRRAHSANPCFAHDSFVYTYESYEKYSNSIQAMDLGIFQHKEVQVVESTLAAMYIRICNELGHSNPSGGYRIAFDQFYHFGKIRSTDTKLHQSLIENCMSNIYFKEIEGKGFTVLKEFTNDLEGSEKFRRDYSLS